MNSSPLTSRRTLLLSAAVISALQPLGQAIAQTANAKGDWLAMIKAQHQLIAKSLSTLVSTNDRLYTTRDSMIRAVAYQLTAHSVAEENVLYPALAMNGMVTESDKLYLDQAHAKVMQAQVEMQSAKDRPGTEWLVKAQALQAAVLKHATEDEENNFYPKLHQKLSPAENGLLTAAFVREFATVKPTRPVV